MEAPTVTPIAAQPAPTATSSGPPSEQRKWTEDEKKRLVHLLQKHPSDAINSHTLAEALGGTKSVLEVAVFVDALREKAPHLIRKRPAEDEPENPVPHCMECIDPFGEPLPKIIRKRRGSKWVRMDPPHLVSRDHLFKGSKIKQAWAKACIRNGAPLAVPSKGGSLTKDQMIDRNAGPPLTPEMVPPLVSRFKTWLTTIIDASALLAYERHKYGIVYHHRVSAAKAANGFCPVRARDIHAAIRHLYPEYLPALTSGADGGDDAIAEDETFDTDEMDGEEDDGATKAAEDGEPEEQDDAEDDEEEGMDVDEDG